jgi:phage tail-like protein
MPPKAGTTTNLLNVGQFSIEIDQVSWGFFKSVGGITTETDVIESMVTNKDGLRIIQKIPGQHKYGEITLSRAYTGDDMLYNWRKQVIDGKVNDARRNGSIVAYDTEFNRVAKWDFENAWPSSWKVSDLDAGTNEAMTEELTLTHEGIVQSKP